MKKINEIFYSLQGEGSFTGTPMVFIRFSGCNLDCKWCDTDSSKFTEMSDDDILAEVEKCYSESGAMQSAGPDVEKVQKYVCLTGGEPGLQVDSALLNLLHMANYEIHMETNGTVGLPPDIDWVVLSPKSSAKPAVTDADEIKVVYDGQPDEELACWLNYVAEFYYIQPCWVGDEARRKRNVEAAVAFVEKHPQWRLSLQAHKYLGIR
ncbi:MAG: 7-carboxy-7-deazaguanine synthase QueE [Bacteroidales bacterium]|jgi:organic radical activating enzyme|nr:7-carboxy-7-deazaguanine synthase QueE [Bacteroidales bacterium]MCI2121271.1 7-carboxy-7-deazaguanine synthase QueE [Bacteroidales bacterium]MCI2146133.1 7-carboxy-7-deazaguanine synthase QueE [Bacteroidales bacterium]